MVVIEKTKLDFACGQNKREGFTGVDESGDADIIHDLFSFPYPFDDNSADEIHSSHFIEHLPMEYVMQNGRRKDMLFAFIDECYRILKTGGKVTLIFPCASSDRAFQDPTHRRFIPQATAYYFNKGWREANKLDHYNVDCDFDFIVGEVDSLIIQGRNDQYKAFAKVNYRNSIDDLHFILTKR